MDHTTDGPDATCNKHRTLQQLNESCERRVVVICATFSNKITNMAHIVHNETVGATIMPCMPPYPAFFLPCAAYDVLFHTAQMRMYLLTYLCWNADGVMMFVSCTEGAASWWSGCSTWTQEVPCGSTDTPRECWPAHPVSVPAGSCSVQVCRMLCQFATSDCRAVRQWLSDGYVSRNNWQKNSWKFWVNFSELQFHVNIFFSGRWKYLKPIRMHCMLCSYTCDCLRSIVFGPSVWNSQLIPRCQLIRHYSLSVKAGYSLMWIESDFKRLSIEQIFD